jgi:hypothetical protein
MKTQQIIGIEDMVPILENAFALDEDEIERLSEKTKLFDDLKAESIDVLDVRLRLERLIEHRFNYKNGTINVGKYFNSEDRPIHLQAIADNALKNGRSEVYRRFSYLSSLPIDEDNDKYGPSLELGDILEIANYASEFK